MQHIFKIKLKTTNTNIQLKNCRLGKWVFNWNGNNIEAYSLSKYNPKNISDPFDSLEHDFRLGLGLFVDSITICANFGVNTDIVISTNPDVLIFKSPGLNTLQDVDTTVKLIRGKKVVCNASSMSGDMPNRIDERLTLQLTDEAISEIERMLEIFNECKLTRSNMKLLNYWRKGVDLDQLGLIEESFLAFYKIIEYFIKSSTIKTSDIPKQYLKDKPMIAAYRFAAGAKLKKLNTDHYELVKDFIDLRNHWDVAHSKTNNIPQVRYSALYYSYFDDLWDYHSHICQLSRFVVLSKIGIKNIALESDGGLYKLVFK